MIIKFSKRKSSLILSFFIFYFVFNAQEALKSTEEEYYDFLSLSGLVERPTLGYRTLNDSVWTFNEVESFEENEDGTFTKVRIPGKESNGNIWKNNNLGRTYTLWTPSKPADNWFTRGLKQGLTAKIYGPEWFNSYNSAAPYGQNDGALWQGKGYNTALTSGLRLEGYGFEMTFKPQISFSQNLEFEYTKPYSGYSGELYENKASSYGDYSLGSLDAPQRFGDKSFWNFDLGDTEFRWTWRTFTIGLGTENIWLGPAQLNPIMHSNNGPGYPHLDFGIRKQKIAISNLNFGDIEFRYWMGKTTESQFFDNNDTNNDTLITGLFAAYKPPFFDGLTIGLNRTMLTKWKDKSAYAFFTLLNPFMKSTAGYDQNDQRASIFMDYYIPKGGIDIYFEWGKNDYNSGLDNLIRYPFHTQAITAGLKKSIDFKNTSKIYGQFLCELTYIESSMDYHFFYDWGGIGNDFYTHHIITQGYTNQGQYLGAGIGAGGNSQFASYKLFYPKGSTELFLYRINPDLNYFYFLAPRDTSSKTPNEDIKCSIRTLLNIGLSSTYYISPDFRILGSFIISDEHNPLNINDNEKNKLGNKDSIHRINLIIQLSIKYLL